MTSNLFDYPNEDYLTDKEASEVLGVSTATVRNWVKLGHIKPASVHLRNRFLRSHIEEIKNKISVGSLAKLNKRANKGNSISKIIPTEYADNREVFEPILKITELFKKYNLDKDTVLLVTAMNLLRQTGLIEDTQYLSLNRINYTNEIVKTEIEKWLDSQEVRQIAKHYNEIFDAEIPINCDFLGLLHQSLLNEGERSKTGSYYTPKHIVDEVVKENIKSSYNVLDPCCGTGQFLLIASEKIDNPSNLWGFDIDESAVRLAKINLFLKFPKHRFKPNIYCKNSLLEDGNGIPNFDLVMTNPPWGSHFSKDEELLLKKRYQDIKSNEAFAYFLEVGIGYLKEGGTLSFILPESILNIKIHKDIREKILKQTTIKKITYLNRPFDGVFTNAVRIDLVNKKADKSSFIAKKEDLLFHPEQTRLLSNKDFIFDVFTDKNDYELTDKVFAVQHSTLKDNAIWALGIVTGNNKKHLQENNSSDLEPILTGKDIKRFCTNKPSKYIRFVPDKFQQVAPEEKYRAKEKLLYKFISKQLVFAYDDKQTLTLNSANVLIPTISNYPIKTILALFNSTLYQFIFEKKFGAIKVLKSHIEQLPLPDINKKEHIRFEKLVDELLKKDLGMEERKSVYKKLDDEVMNLFFLEKQEKNHIYDGVNVSDKLLEVN